MSDDKKPPIFTDDDRVRLKEKSVDYDRHFLPKPGEQEEKQTDDK